MIDTIFVIEVHHKTRETHKRHEKGENSDKDLLNSLWRRLR